VTIGTCFTLPKVSIKPETEIVCPVSATMYAPLPKEHVSAWESSSAWVVEAEVAWELTSLCDFRPASLGGGFGGISDTVSSLEESFISDTWKPTCSPSDSSRSHFLDMLSPMPPFFSFSELK
jgi:hypothetical protein